MPKGKVPNDDKAPSGSPIGTPTAIGKVIIALPTLTEKELRSVQAAVDQALDNFYDEDDKELYFMVYEIVGEKPIAFNRFSTSSNGSVWRRNVGRFYALEQEIIDSRDVRKPVRQALRRFLLQLLFDHIKGTGQPLNIKIVSQQMGYIESVYKLSFPGYLENKMAYLILSKLGG